MPSIDDLGLPPEPMGDIDYNAPEPGSFPPSMKPGTYQFVFHLGPVPDAPAEDYFGTVEISDDTNNPNAPKRKYLQVLHHATTTIQHPSPNDHSLLVNDEVTLTYQRVNFYKHPKMANSSAGDLIRALDLRTEGALTPQAVDALFRSVDGRKSYTAEVIWRAFCKTCSTTISTAPRKKKGELPWPKMVNGELPEMAECPVCHQKHYAQAQIDRYKLPAASPVEQAQTA